MKVNEPNDDFMKSVFGPRFQARVKISRLEIHYKTASHKISVSKTLVHLNKRRTNDYSSISCSECEP